jgi:hypothetical protein
MQHLATPLPQLLLPPHLAAACIFAGTRRETPRCAPPPSGVLAELARLRLAR